MGHVGDRWTFGLGDLGGLFSYLGLCMILK